MTVSIAKIGSRSVRYSVSASVSYRFWHWTLNLDKSGLKAFKCDSNHNIKSH